MRTKTKSAIVQSNPQLILLLRQAPLLTRNRLRCCCHGCRDKGTKVDLRRERAAANAARGRYAVVPAHDVDVAGGRRRGFGDRGARLFGGRRLWRCFRCGDWALDLRCVSYMVVGCRTWFWGLTLCSPMRVPASTRAESAPFCRLPIVVRRKRRAAGAAPQTPSGARL